MVLRHTSDSPWDHRRSISSRLDGTGFAMEVTRVAARRRAVAKKRMLDLKVLLIGSGNCSRLFASFKGEWTRASDFAANELTTEKARARARTNLTENQRKQKSSCSCSCFYDPNHSRSRYSSHETRRQRRPATTMSIQVSSCKAPASRRPRRESIRGRPRSAKAYLHHSQAHL